jgi:ribosomal protein S14
VALQRLQDHKTGEDADDLKAWLQTLVGCPSVEVTALASCGNDSHGAEPPTWFYVEADRAAGVARRRCLACGSVHHILDSESNWTSGIHTSTCPTCAQSMFEVAAGLHTASSPEPDQPVVSWVALGTRCVTCGRVDGLTDMFVPDLPVADVVAAL